MCLISAPDTTELLNSSLVALITLQQLIIGLLVNFYPITLGCVVAELMLGQPLFPGESGVDQLVEIIKVK
jgi:hypothetical protein